MPHEIDLYREMLAALAPIGPFAAEQKKTCTHLVRGTAFAGVHPRKGWLRVTIKSATPVKSARVVKSEQLSKNRWYFDVKVESADDLDAELVGWMRAAYDLCG
jgi:hypothetical protein